LMLARPAGVWPRLLSIALAVALLLQTAHTNATCTTEEGIDYSGHDLKPLTPHTVGSYGECCDLCLQTTGCSYYTYGERATVPCCIVATPTHACNPRRCSCPAVCQFYCSNQRFPPSRASRIHYCVSISPAPPRGKLLALLIAVVAATARQRRCHSTALGCQECVLVEEFGCRSREQE